MSSAFSTRRRPLMAVLLLATALLGGAASSAFGVPDEPQLVSSAARELWQQGSNQILAGDFDNALHTIEQVQKIEPGHAQVSSALTWLRDAKTLAASREHYRAQIYDYYVAEAKKKAKEARENPQRATEKKPESKKKADAAASKDKPKVAAKDKAKKTDKDKDKDEEEKEKEKGYRAWWKALAYAQAAMSNAKDENAFRKEPWLQEIVDHVSVEIDQHKKAYEWRDALTLYDMLKIIYPDNQTYQDGFDFCSKRAHFDFVYGPKSNWRQDLRDVTPSVLPQIVERLDEDYVNKVSFKKLLTSAIDHLIILGQAESLNVTFPQLGDRDRVRSFVTQLQGLAKGRIAAKRDLTMRDVRDVFGRVLDANKNSIILPECVIVDEFVSGLFEPLDEFTSVIWPSEVPEFNKHTRGDFVGVGIQITQGDGKYVRVETPLEDSPAYKAGVKPGDLITHVDGKSTMDMTVTQAVSAITGEPGTKVILRMQDPQTQKSVDLALRREHIKLRTVRGHQRDESKPTGWDYTVDPDNKICYVRVSGFMDKTVKDLETALDQMRRDGCKGLILDLRFNPGGLLTSAINMCELFMKDSNQIVSTKGRSRQGNMDISARSEGKFSDLPLIILVNEYSASASEIVAGALSGLKEACIVGTRSFGKGSVQNLIPIADNSAYLKLTTAHYYVYDADMPEEPWYCLHKEKDSKTWGVEPHVVVKVIPSEINKILKLRRERDVLKGKSQHDVPKEILDRTPTSEPAEELPKDPDPQVDPQIAAAVDIMRMKLVSGQPWKFESRQQRSLARANPAPKNESANAVDR